MWVVNLTNILYIMLPLMTVVRSLKQITRLKLSSNVATKLSGIRCIHATSPPSLEDVQGLIDTFKRGKSPSMEILRNILNQSRKQHEILPNVIRVSIPTTTITEEKEEKEASTIRTESSNETKVEGNNDEVIESHGPPGGLVVVGDTHGQFTDLMGMIFSDKVVGFPSSDNVFIFNGDFVDRGENSLGVIITLLAIKLALPNAIHLVRGNHESVQMNERFGFTTELQFKFPNDFAELFALFTETFNALPLAAVIENAIFVVHGGIGPATYKMSIADIDKLNRFRQPDFAEIRLDSLREVDTSYPSEAEFTELNGVGELLWSDPAENFSGFKRNSRGGGTTVFGADATEYFLKLNQLQYIVRSHVMQANGFSVGHDGRCLTIFSAPNYCGGKNLGAVMRYRDNSKILDPEVIQYKAVDHPKPKPTPARKHNDKSTVYDEMM